MLPSLSRLVNRYLRRAIGTCRVRKRWRNCVRNCYAPRNGRNACGENKKNNHREHREHREKNQKEQGQYSSFLVSLFLPLCMFFSVFSVLSVVNSQLTKCVRSLRIALYFSSLMRSTGTRSSWDISCTVQPSKLICRMRCWRGDNTSEAA